MTTFPAKPISEDQHVSMRYLTRQQLREEFGIAYSRAHLARLEKAGRFPQRVRLSANRVAWVESEVIAWGLARNQAREAA